MYVCMYVCTVSDNIMYIYTHTCTCINVKRHVCIENMLRIDTVMIEYDSDRYNFGCFWVQNSPPCLLKISL